MRYFLAPRSGERAHINSVSTIKHGVPFEKIKPYLKEEGRVILQKQEVIYAWGNREGKKAPWYRMSEGDTVIFYDKGFYVSAADVIYKEYNPDLAFAMWPKDENGNPWSYTFFLTNFRYFKIPKAQMNIITGYKSNFVLQGFLEVSPERIETVLNHYNSFEDLFRAFPDEESVEIPKDHERVYVNLPQEVNPTLLQRKIIPYQESITKSGKKKIGFVDFEEVNKHRAKIGSLGETIVIEYEKKRLLEKGLPHLAEKVHQLSLENTYAGYDIISYDEQGNEIKIEVKAHSKKDSDSFSFHISDNEHRVAEACDNYYIYVVYDVRSINPKIHILDNPFKNPDHLKIKPTNFLVRGNFEKK